MTGDQYTCLLGLLIIGAIPGTVGLLAAERERRTARSVDASPGSSSGSTCRGLLLTRTRPRRTLRRTPISGSADAGALPRGPVPCLVESGDRRPIGRSASGPVLLAVTRFERRAAVA